MVNLDDGVCEQIGRKISDYSKLDTLSATSALLTIPRYSANTNRIETLVHLSVIHCNGSKKISQNLINDVLNNVMGNTFIAHNEDPAEDVFVSNILTKFGDYLVFNSIWQANDYFVQTIIDVIDKKPEFDVLQNVRGNINALLKISDEIANRAKLSRNCWALSEPNENLKLPSTQKLLKYAKRVIFSKDDLAILGVIEKQLQPFVFYTEDEHSTSSLILENTSLERRPIVLIDGLYVISLPGAIGIALRRYFLEECRANGLLKFFQDTLKSYQEYQLTHEILKEYRNDAELIEFDTQKIKNLPSMYSVSTKDDSNRYVHAMLFHDDLSKILDEGIDSYYQHTKDELDAIRKYFSVVAKYCANQNGFTGGQFLCSIGGLGRGHSINFDDWPSRWNLSFVTLNDLLLHSRTKSKPLSELFLCLAQKSWYEDCGVEFLNINGDINYYGYWLYNDYKCIPDDLSITKGSVLIPPTDCVFTLRRNLRTTTDRHSVLDYTGKWVKVERLEKNPLFESLKHLPVYGCIDHLEDGLLNAVIESNFANIWFGLLNETNNISDNIIDWWSGFVYLLAKSVHIIDKQVNIQRKSNIQLRFNFSNLKLSNNAMVCNIQNHKITTVIRGNVVDICLSENYLLTFTKEANTGEREILMTLVDSISKISIANGTDIEPYIDDAIESVVGDPGVRIIHVFNPPSYTDYLLSKKAGTIKFCNETRITFDKIKIIHSLGISNATFCGKKMCSNVLHNIVQHAWLKIKSKLSLLNKIMLLTKLSDQLVLLELDRMQWKTTARPIQSIYKKDDDVIKVANTREQSTGLTTTCLRGIIEMACCDSMNKDGIYPTDDLIDELLSLCSVLISAANDSDAVHLGLTQPTLWFHPNGLYQLPSNIYSDIVGPYFADCFEHNFSNAVDSYGDIYSGVRRTKKQKIHNEFNKKFIAAFEAETALPLHSAIMIFTELLDIFVKTDVTSTVIKIKEVASLVEKNRGIITSHFYQFLKCFSLYPRESWDIFPRGYDYKDAAPWKHKRRMSCLVKPIIILDDNFIFLNLQFLKYASIFFYRAQNGYFHSEFFHSQAMKSYVGMVTHAKGSEFTDQVCRHFLDIGWKVKNEVSMTSLEAPTVLGDIDVMATKEGNMLIIECKNLHIPITISEIADIRNRFRGELKDELSKHLARVNWVKKNITKLQIHFQTDSIQKVQHYLITKDELPIHYFKDLPIDSSKILPFRKLSEIS